MFDLICPRANEIEIGMGVLLLKNFWSPFTKSRALGALILQFSLDVAVSPQGVNDFDELLRPSSSSAGGAADEESESEAASLDLDVASDTSSNTTVSRS